MPTPADADDPVSLLPFCDVSLVVLPVLPVLPVLTAGLTACAGAATGAPAATPPGLAKSADMDLVLAPALYMYNCRAVTC